MKLNWRSSKVWWAKGIILVTRSFNESKSNDLLRSVKQSKINSNVPISNRRSSRPSYHPSCHHRRNWRRSHCKRWDRARINLIQTSKGIWSTRWFLRRGLACSGRSRVQWWNRKRGGWRRRHHYNRWRGGRKRISLSRQLVWWVWTSLSRQLGWLRKRTSLGQ